MSKGLHHAVEQIRDYRRWLADNALYFREASGCWGIELGAHAWVVIGRRADRANTLGADRLRDLQRERIDVMSYDRLLENFSAQAGYMFKQRRDIEELVARLGTPTSAPAVEPKSDG